MQNAGLTYDGIYDSITNELTFYRQTEEDTWEGVIHFDQISLPVNGPYIEWKNGKEWVAKNWKWWSNTVIGTAVLAVLVATRQHVNTLKGKLTTAEYDANILKGKLTTAEDDANILKGKLTTAEQLFPSDEYQHHKCRQNTDAARPDGALPH